MSQKRKFLYFFPMGKTEVAAARVKVLLIIRVRTRVTGLQQRLVFSIADSGCPYNKLGVVNTNPLCDSPL